MSTAIAPARAMREELVRYTPRMIEAVGMRGADEYVQRQFALAMLKIKDSADLQRCAPDSIATALIRLCGERLEVGVTAHLVPMKGQCAYMRDWKGDVELMIRAGYVRDVKPYLVHEHDHFREYVRAGTPVLDWEGAPGDRGALVKVFALVILPRGLTSHEVMTKAEVDAIRAKAPSPNSPAWRDHYGEMAKKTVVHRVAKRFPKGDAKGATWTDDDAPSERDAQMQPPKPVVSLPTGDPYPDDDAPADLTALGVATETRARTTNPMDAGIGA